MKPILKYLGVLIVFFIIPEFTVSSQTIIMQDTVQGIWNKAGSPYIIHCNISLPQDTSLIIEAGTKIEFTGYYLFNVFGKLIAEGTKKEPVVFAFTDCDSLTTIGEKRDSTGEIKVNGWRGIRFRDSLPKVDTSILTYCKITGVKTLTDDVDDVTGGALSLICNDLVMLSKSYIYGNEAHLGAGLYADGSKVQIDGCIFENNRSLSDGGALYFLNSSVTLLNTIIRGNSSQRIGGGILANGIKGDFYNNIIAENHAWIGGAISLQNSVVSVINNTISDNRADIEGGGLYLHNSSPVIMNSILSGNTAAGNKEQLFLNFFSYPELAYNLIEGGRSQITLFTDTAATIAGFDYILNDDPGFENNDSAYYGLLEGSVCIDKGYNEVDALSFPGTDISGKKRSIGAGIDLGASEFGKEDKNLKTTQVETISNEGDQLSVTVFPNPNDGRFIITINGGDITEYTVKIINTNGQLLDIFQLRGTTAGNSFEIEKNLFPGIYYLELKDIEGKVFKREKIVIE